jgi:hypothetical protein
VGRERAWALRALTIDAFGAHDWLARRATDEIDPTARFVRRAVANAAPATDPPTLGSDPDVALAPVCAWRRGARARRPTFGSDPFVGLGRSARGTTFVPGAKKVPRAERNARPAWVLFGCKPGRTFSVPETPFVRRGSASVTGPPARFPPQRHRRLCQKAILARRVLLARAGVGSLNSDSPVDGGPSAPREPTWAAKSSTCEEKGAQLALGHGRAMAATQTTARNARFPPKAFTAPERAVGGYG